MLGLLSLNIVIALFRDFLLMLLLSRPGGCSDVAFLALLRSVNKQLQQRRNVYGHFDDVTSKYLWKPIRLL